jgi:hypothetical protein
MKLQSVVHIFFYFSYVNSEINLDLNNTSNLADSVREIVNKEYLNKFDNINLVSQDDQEIQVKDFKNFLLTKTNFIFQHHDLTANFSFAAHKMSFLLFLIKDFQSFRRIHGKISPKHFKFNGFYLVILVNGEIEEIFELFWKLQTFNVNVIHDSKNNSVLVKTFMPFKIDNCYDTKSIQINEFKDGKFMNGNENFFPGKMRNLHNCSVRVALSTNSPPSVILTFHSNGSFESKGRDINVIETLSKTLNFATIFQPIEQGYLLENGSSSGIFKAILENKVAILIPGFWLKESRAKVFEFSTTFYIDEISFVIPQPQEFSSIEKLIYPFSLDSWITILFCFGSGLIVIFFFSKTSLEIKSFVFGTGVRNPYMNILIGIVGNVQHVLPRRNFARFLLMNFLILALVLRTVYQGSYFELMKSNRKHKEIKTVAEIIEAKFDIYTTRGNEDVFKGSKVLLDR